MRTVPAALSAHLSGPATTLCQCWRLTRGDGLVLGFTDHDEAIEFDGTRFEAAAGLRSSEAEAAVGLGAGSQEAEGVLSSAAITEADIAAGRYDGARVEVFCVNWQAPAERVLLTLADLGEVTRDGTRFRAELRGMAARLGRMRGRIYSRRCDAALGDARCGVDLSAAGRRVAATVREAGAAGLVLDIAGPAVDPAAFAGGSAAAETGAAAGLRGQILELAPATGGGWRLATMEPFGVAPKAGDGMRLTVGCDKSFGTCRDRFRNADNFRGFPHLPGSDAALRIAKREGLHDGGPLVP